MATKEEPLAGGSTLEVPGAESAILPASTQAPDGAASSLGGAAAEGGAEPPVDTSGAVTVEFGFETMGGVGRYLPGDLLGAGGMGEVQLFVDRRIGRRVARKTIRAARDDALSMRRFLREARVQGQLEHPAVVPVYDLDVDADEQVYFTMKRVQGETLERVLTRMRSGEGSRRFGRRRLLSAFAQVCLAVDYAHTRRVVHRDLKPSNVMLGSHGEVYLLDWGLAKVVGEPEATAADGGTPTDPSGAQDDAGPSTAPRGLVGASDAITAGGARLGTLAYMAPEQLRGRGASVDARADVYALGAILFEILTLSRFRRETDVRAVLDTVASGVVERPSERATRVPPELDELCARALAPLPEDRPASAREMAEEIELYLDGEHDAMLRRELAARHAATARRYAEAEAGERTRASKGADAPVVSSRVAAMREAMKALALDADHVEAQKVLIDVLTSGSEAVPPAARTELEAVDERVRAGGVRVAMWGMVFWFAVVPLVLVAGVESWPMVIAPAALTVLAILFARHVLSLGRVTTGAALAMGGAAAFIMALVSCYMGPFALVPTGAVTSAMVFAMSASRRERPIGQAVFVLGALVPFLVEIAGIFPRAYSFDPGRIVVHARAIGLPQWPTMALMAASTIGWIIVSSVLVGRMRDALGAAEQRQFLQAWYLRQLFPDASERPDEPPPSAPASALPRRRWT